MSSAATTRPILADNDNSWSRVPYQVSFGKQFTSMAEAARYAILYYDGDGKHGSSAPKEYGGNLGSDEAIAEFLNMNASYIGKPFFKDTRIGANDAINCIWQFNRDDDIVYPASQTESATSEYDGVGMGRVYAETTEQNQSIAWFTFGVPRFATLSDFFLNAFDKGLIKLNATGNDASMAEKLGKLFGTLGALAIALPFVPFVWLDGIIHHSRDYTVNRFYDLRATMHLYYRYADSILAHWLVNTGIYGTRGEGSMSGISAPPESLPIAMQATGPSLFDILARRAKTASMDPSHYNIDDEFLTQIGRLSKEYDDDATNPWNNHRVDWSTAFKHTALGATQFVGFRIEKDVDSSESFSNSTRPNQLAEQINSASQDASQKFFDFGGTDGFNTGSDLVNGAIEGVSGLFTKAFNVIGVDNIASAVTGGAFIDIPESYASSDYNKSHSITLQLRAPYGDITSIYQSIMVPLSLLMAAALPRAAGENAYQQPFFLKCYSKGRFAVPLGVIDSMTIKRGSSEFGWTYQNLPTCVDVTLSIKDLSPAMYMAMVGDTLVNPFGSDSAFQEYLLTLAGTGLFERISRFQSFKRKMMLNMHNVRNRILNPMFHASWIGDSNLVTFFQGFLPWTSVSRN